MLGRLLAVAAFVLVAAGAQAAPTPLAIGVFSKTGLPLGGIVWTGTQFLYVAERTGEIDASGPAGTGLTKFASLPPEYEEVRCVVVPGAKGWAINGWTAGDVYCHGPHGEIWRVGPDGSVGVFATLPDTSLQDGSIAFQESGVTFGGGLVAASGGSASSGGTVYRVDTGGVVRKVGDYAGPGGAENLAFAPAGFGSAASDVLLAIDGRGKGGRLLAMSPAGTVRTLATFPVGINPIAALATPPGRPTPRGAAKPGVYLTDTLRKNVYLVPASALTQFAGGVLVGREKGLPLFWVVLPDGKGFSRVRLHSNLELQKPNWNLEGALYIP